MLSLRLQVGDHASIRLATLSGTNSAVQSHSLVHRSTNHHCSRETSVSRQIRSVLTADSYLGSRAAGSRRSRSLYETTEMLRQTSSELFCFADVFIYEHLSDA